MSIAENGVDVLGGSSSPPSRTESPSCPPLSLEERVYRGARCHPGSLRPFPGEARRARQLAARWQRYASPGAGFQCEHCVDGARAGAGRTGRVGRHTAGATSSLFLLLRVLGLSSAQLAPAGHSGAAGKQLSA